jgi:hypothetical protein|eukprot:COSAG06_NODE_7996_length_2307_cov_2.780344_2_plen_49_part_00
MTLPQGVGVMSGRGDGSAASIITAKNARKQPQGKQVPLGAPSFAKVSQ